MKPNGKDICHFFLIMLETEAEHLMRLLYYVIKVAHWSNLCLKLRNRKVAEA